MAFRLTPYLQVPNHCEVIEVDCAMDPVRPRSVPMRDFRISRH
jgi:hypothetical protein